MLQLTYSVMYCINVFQNTHMILLSSINEFVNFEDA